jgi:peptidylprolyl isomerase
MKLALAVFALSSAALAQTPAPATAAKPVTHTAATTASKTAAPGAPKSGPPKVVGVPHTMYSLKYIDTKIGTGPLAEPRKYYTVNYTGYFPDGTKFDSSLDRKEPFTFPYGAHRVIIGWDTGFEGMHVGGKRRLFVPYQLAYGPLGNPPRMPAKANLIFDVELISFSDTPPAPPKPPAAPKAAPAKPADAPAAAPAGAPATPPPASAPATPPPASAPATPPPAPEKSATPPSK